MAIVDDEVPYHFRNKFRDELAEALELSKEDWGDYSWKELLALVTNDRRRLAMIKRMLDA